jgi:hypothetical protein
MCFATVTKGLTALAIQAFTTAHQLDVVEELKTEMSDFIPIILKSIEGSLPAMAPKAYRWVREMEEIAATHVEEGGFDETLFQGVAGVYRNVADDTILGLEKTGNRKRGRTLEDVAVVMGEGLDAKRKKKE